MACLNARRRAANPHELLRNGGATQGTGTVGTRTETTPWPVPVADNYASWQLAVSGGTRGRRLVLEQLAHWPVLRRLQLAGLQEPTEDCLQTLVAREDDEQS